MAGAMKWLCNSIRNTNSFEGKNKHQVKVFQVNKRINWWCSGWSLFPFCITERRHIRGSWPEQRWDSGLQRVRCIDLQGCPRPNGRPQSFCGRLPATDVLLSYKAVILKVGSTPIAWFDRYSVLRWCKLFNTLLISFYTFLVSFLNII